MREINRVLLMAARLRFVQVSLIELERRGTDMKAALIVAAVILVASVPVGAQSIGGILAPPVVTPSLPWTPPASPQAIEVTGTDATYLPSTFVSFDRAVAVGKDDIREQAKTVAQVAAESRQTAKAAAKIRVAQDNRGKLVVAKN
jgi:hypothetical protein